LKAAADNKSAQGSTRQRKNAGRELTNKADPSGILAGGIFMNCFYRGIDPVTSNFLTEIMEDAWSEADGLAALRLDPLGTHAAMVCGISAAVDQGDRDPVRLRNLALEIAQNRQLHRTPSRAAPTTLGTVLRRYVKRIALMAKFTV
jgi:hypothetical protein